MNKAERDIIIRQLWDLGVQSGSAGQPLREMDYYSLVRLLAVKQAVVE